MLELAHFSTRHLAAVLRNTTQSSMEKLVAVSRLQVERRVFEDPLPDYL